MRGRRAQVMGVVALGLLVSMLALPVPVAASEGPTSGSEMVIEGYTCNGSFTCASFPATGTLWFAQTADQVQVVLNDYGFFRLGAGVPYADCTQDLATYETTGNVTGDVCDALDFEVEWIDPDAGLCRTEVSIWGYNYYSLHVEAVGRCT